LEVVEVEAQYDSFHPKKEKKSAKITSSPDKLEIVEVEVQYNSLHSKKEKKSYKNPIFS